MRHLHAAVTLLIVTASSCSIDSSDPQSVATNAVSVSAISLPSLGRSCSADSDCLTDSNAMCAGTGGCLCRPGFIACDDRCYDVAHDHEHCGACSVGCGPDSVCDHGVCGGPT